MLCLSEGSTDWLKLPVIWNIPFQVLIVKITFVQNIQTYKGNWGNFYQLTYLVMTFSFSPLYEGLVTLTLCFSASRSRTRVLQISASTLRTTHGMTWVGNRCGYTSFTAGQRESMCRSSARRSMLTETMGASTVREHSCALPLLKTDMIALHQTHTYFLVYSTP